MRLEIIFCVGFLLALSQASPIRDGSETVPKLALTNTGFGNVEQFIQELVVIPTIQLTTAVELTTVVQATVEPIAVELTTVEPTIVEKATVEQTTVVPTTVEPVTVVPTIVVPTTVVPVVVPETLAVKTVVEQAAVRDVTKEEENIREINTIVAPVVEQVKPVEAQVETRNLDRETRQVEVETSKVEGETRKVEGETSQVEAEERKRLGEPAGEVVEARRLLDEIQSGLPVEIKKLVVDTVDDVKSMEAEIRRLIGGEINHIVSSTGGKVREVLPVEEALIRDICLSPSQFKYFQPYPNDASKYVVCDSWGKASVISCDIGSVFDEFMLKCVLPSELKNETSWWLSSLEKSLNQFDCNSTETACLNGGECRKVNGGVVSRCVCVGNYTGDLCEIKIDPSNVYSSIVSGQFSLQEYRSKLEKTMEKQNLTNEFSSESIKQYGDLAMIELKKYLSLHKKGELRYDQVVNTLIEDLLIDIYPDAYTLSLYNASNEKLSSVIRFMPSLIAYAKYSNERNQLVFYEFQRTLNKLVDLVRETCKSAPIRATGYVNFVSTLANLTGAVQLDGETVVPNNNWSSETVMENMEGQYKETSGQTEVLVKLLEDFEKIALDEIKKNPGVGEVTLGNSTCTGANQIAQVFDTISKSSGMVWESLIGYGFWFITNSIANY